MYKYATIVAMAVVVLGTLTGLAQDSDQNGAEAPPVDEALFDQGEELFETNCAVCHQSSGEGNSPAFPALAGNDNLQDVALIVTTVHNGRNAMPAFPQFGAEELAALATYVRNAWSNEFGGVDVEQVAAQLEEEDAGDGEGDAADEEGAPEESAGEGEMVSIWDGVYTEEQAERGQPVYGRCAECHGQIRISSPAGPDQTDVAYGPPSTRESILLHVTDPGNIVSGPPLAGPIFFDNWDGNTVASLFEFTRTTMPQDAPGALSDQEYIDVIAFMFAAGDVPAGDEELPPESSGLDHIVIETEPEESE